MTRRTPVIGSLVVCLVVLAGCGSSVAPGSGADTTSIPPLTPTLPTPTTTTVPTTTPASPTGPSLTLAVEPADRFGSVDQIIQQAGVSLDLTMSRLTDPEMESLLLGAHRRGVSVRALLDHAGSSGAANLAAYSLLHAGGVPVRWGPDSVVFHQSTITADHDVSAVMSAGPDPVATTIRNYVVLDRQSAAVASIESVFASDWNAAPVGRVPSVDGLVWSPGAKPTVVGLIAGAQHSLSMECGQLASMAVVSALRVASRRGVTVTLTMTADPQWAREVAQLARAGVRIATYPAGSTTLAIQATAMVVDSATAFVGSQLITTESLVHDRELGQMTSDPAVVDPLTLTLAGDFARATLPGAATPAAGPTTPTTSAPAG